MDPLLTLPEIRNCRDRLSGRIALTPVHAWAGREKDDAIGKQVDVAVKLELLQHTGSFKVRGAINTVLNLPSDALERGITTVSAGNHAAATAYAARAVGARAKVVMPRTASPVRMSLARYMARKSFWPTMSRLLSTSWTKSFVAKA